MRKLTSFLLALCGFTLVNAQWHQQYSGVTTNLNTVFCISDSTVFVAGDNGLVLKTINMGYSWQVQSTGVTQKLNALSFANDLVGYAVGDTGTLIKTIDGGTTWSILNSTTTQNLNSVVFTGIDTGYIAGNGSSFLKTTDGGISWNSLSISGGCCGYLGGLNAVGGKIYVLGYDLPGLMLASSGNGGTSWNTWTDPEASMDNWWSGKTMAVYDNGTGNEEIIPGYDGTIKHVNNMGGYLNMFGAPVSDTVLNGISLDFRGTTTATAVGNNGVIGLYPNSGPGTNTQVSGVTTRLNAVQFHDAATGYIVGDAGVILATFDIHAGVNEMENHPYRIMAYPNPFSFAATIVCNAEMENASLVLFDVYGRQVKQASPVTGHVVTIGREDLPAGTYFLRIEQKGQLLSTGKLMIVD